MYENIRIVFFGTTDFACRILQTLINEKYNVAAVVAQPDKPVGRKHIITPTPVHAMADENHITFLAPVRLRNEYQSVLDQKPDLIVTCAYGQIVPDEILAFPKYGCLNIHPSLLPKYRGGAPMHHAIWSGDKKTGVCLMEMTHAMDAGKIYAECDVSIGDDDTLDDLESKLMDASCALLKENLPLYLDGKLPGREQDESGVVIARNISREEEQIHFETEDVQEAYNHMRALISWPMPWGIIEGKRMHFCKVRKTEKESGKEPGTVLGFADHAMHVAAKGGEILVYEMQMEGKKRMNADAFENGIGRTLTGKKFE